MSIRIYNSLTDQKEEFVPVTPGKVGIYLCGPTVYKPSHIGHAVGPVIFDAIKRYLVHRGYEVRWVVNITDVEDKLIAEAARLGIPVPDLAAQVTENYFAALAALNVSGIDHFPKASEYIGAIIALIERLIARGAAYVSEGDVYFDVTAATDYGKLSNRRTDDQLGQRELRSGTKRNAGDFALWKAAKPDEPAEVKYDSPWGPGRPGWHIECSAMAMKLLGETFDIHGGGLDLIFPHHENEVAQSETCTGKPFARYWMHHGLTRFNTKKVSKSDPEMQAALAEMTISNLLKRYDGELLRFFILSTHYRRPIEYSAAELAAKQKGLNTFYRLFARVSTVAGRQVYEGVPAGSRPVLPIHEPTPERQALEADVTGGHQRFEAAMDDDFNTAAAIAVLFDLANAINRFIERTDLEEKRDSHDAAAAFAATQILIGMGRLLGLFLAPPKPRSVEDGAVARVMQAHIAVRAFCREQKLYALADRIRDGLAACGVTLTDKPAGTVWEIAAPVEEAGLDALVQVLLDVRQQSRKERNYAAADRVRDELAAVGIVLEDKPGDATVWHFAS
jgi:cysteinyl-tRNA synthetase